LGFKRDAVLAYLSQRDVGRTHVNAFGYTQATDEQLERVTDGENGTKVLTEGG
jgi:hypothetical protein